MFLGNLERQSERRQARTLDGHRFQVELRRRLEPDRPQYSWPDGQITRRAAVLGRLLRGGGRAAGQLPQYSGLGQGRRLRERAQPRQVLAQSGTPDDALRASGVSEARQEYLGAGGARKRARKQGDQVPGHARLGLNSNSVIGFFEVFLNV